MPDDVDVSLLSPQAVLASLRLIERLCELGSDPTAWRELLIDTLSPMLNAAFSVTYLMKVSLDPADIAPKVLFYIEHGSNQFWKRYVAEGDLTIDPVTPLIMARFGTDFTVSRADWIDDAAWRQSRFFKEVLVHSGWEHAIYSQVGINPPGVVDGLGFCRGIDEPTFTPREVALVKFVHQELARLWRKNAAFDVTVLPLRQRQVLDGIRRGESRKSIAKKLRLSDHTVHSHERALFARAGVKSRGELLAKLATLIQPNLLP